jgi:hypothetical protein
MDTGDTVGARMLLANNVISFAHFIIIFTVLLVLVATCSGTKTNNRPGFPLNKRLGELNSWSECYGKERTISCNLPEIGT